MTSSRGDVVINEVMTAGSERALQWSSTGVPQFGFGAPWHSLAFNDSTWRTGNGPFGFGSFTNAAPPTPTTNLGTAMQNLTPTCYLRKTFNVSAADAARTDPLQLSVQYNDGFVCYINGVEVVRRNAGPTNGFVYHDQFAAFGTPANNEPSTTPYLRTETLALPAANTVLVEGTNVIAIHALNYWDATSAVNTSTNAFVSVDNRNNFYMSPNLSITGSTVVTLVTSASPWKYFAGVAEPSGGVTDPTLLSSGRQSVLWGNPAFDDASWSTGAAPFGAGTPPSGVTLGTNLTSQVITKTPSVYFRIVFSANATDVADNNALQLLMDYDDGFVAYLNGVEVARSNMQEPNSFTPHNAVASAARSGGSSTTYTLDPPSRLLVNGQNVLSVQVHNLSLNDTDLFFRCRLQRFSAAKIFVDYTNTWKYFVGLTEPLVDADESLEDNAEAPDYQLDWMELYNDGAAPASLANWSLSDDPADPAKWKFPAGTSIGAGAYLLVICDGRDIASPPAGGYLHTNFKLDADGESVGLYNPSGTLVQQLAIPALTAFQSFGRDADSSYKLLSVPSPLAANAGTTFDGVVATPTITPAGGFYTGAQSVTLSTATAGAMMRYTTDGSEPTATTGSLYTSPFTVNASSAIRAAAFKTGLLASKSVARTYLINEPASRRSVPAVCLVGDPGRSLYRPYGIMSIVGGAFTNMASPLPTGNNGIWSQTPAGGGTADLTAYDNPIHRGRFLERPVNFELLYPNGTPGLNTQFGLRISGSGHARPRYKLANQNGPTPNNGAWNQTDFTQKPSFNFYFRDDLGGDPLNFPLIPNDSVTQFHDLRCRAGKNDPSNPFVEDELVRRLFIDMGQVGSKGIINTLYVNGVYKGYYNLCEHLREDFFQRHHGSDLAWDVRQVTTIASGDGLSFQEMITFLRQNPQNVLANYKAMKTRIDMVNFVDYLIVNLLGVTGDWPHNNYVAARERSTTGVFRYYVWDAEGAFGDFSGNVRTNQFVAGTTGSFITTTPATVTFGEGIRILYTLLRASPEFKLLFADRLQKHFFNNGALSEAKVLARLNELRTEFQPLLNGANFSDRVTPWENGVGDTTRYTLSGGTSGSTVNNPSRRQVLFNGYTDDTASGAFVQPHLVAEGLWPATRAPGFSPFGGTVAPGATLTMTNPNGSGTIYYTTDGRDPRAEGGAVQGAAGTSVVINFPCTVRARVLSGTGEWSPVTEAFFDTGAVPSLIVSELMYHPPDNGAIKGDEYEFVEIKNVGTQTVPLFGMKFTSGITFTFPAGATIAPGQLLVVARNAAQFGMKYPSVPLLYAWGASSNLSNGGETVALADAAGRTIFSVAYSDIAPWPVAPDGSGPSLVPVDPNAVPLPNSSTNWRASTNNGGSPGEDDPAPPTLPVYINEVLANSTPGTDRVELYNPNASAVDVGDWWLSDDVAVPKKYRIASGTSIAPGGFLVLSEAQFNVGANAFSFSANGDEARLSSADAAGNLTGYSHVFQFGASDNGVSFGRYVNSQGAEFFVAQKAQTFGAENTGPRVGPLVLTELMVEPAAGSDEYIEIRNISDQPVPLFDIENAANTWKIDGINFNFPTGVTLQPRQIVLVSPIAPTTFATKYSVPSAVAVYGPYSGALNNGGERVALQKPGVPYLDIGVPVVPYIDVDAATYDDLAPWPGVAANGKALERINVFTFGDDPQNWQASAAGGSVGKPVALGFNAWLAQQFTPAERANPNIGGMNADPDGDGLDNFREWAHGLNPLAKDASSALTWGIEQESGGSPYLTMHYRRSLGAQGVSFFGDTAADAGTWLLDTALTVGTPINNGDGSETITKRDTIPATGTTPHRFIRLRMTAP